MPISKYFEGNGRKVMRSIRKAHPNWSDEKVKSVFHATANKRHGKPGEKVESNESGGKHTKSTRGGRTVETYEG